jgi:hypothetical protein
MANRVVTLCHQSAAQQQNLAAGWKPLPLPDHQDLVESLAARHQWDEKLCLHPLMKHFE